MRLPAVPFLPCTIVFPAIGAIPFRGATASDAPRDRFHPLRRRRDSQPRHATVATDPDMSPRIILLLAIIGLASACGGRVPATGTSLARTSGGATDSPATAADPAPVLDSYAPTSAAFILSTNEPFWNARVDGDVLVLRGMDGERRLAITVNQALLDGRHVMAQDEAGRVEIRIAPMLCQDSMSGVYFPYTGRLVFDESTPIPGCARPASEPAPGEPAANRQ